MPDPFDPRFRLAVELYNGGIARGFRSEEGKDVVLREGTFKIPFGDLAVTIDPNEFRWGSFRLVKFVNAYELEVRGLRNWYRWPGMGAPLVASLERLPGVEDPAFVRIPPGIKVAVTALLSPDRVEEGLKTGHITATLKVKTTQEGQSTTVDGRTVPVEFGLSSAPAYTLEGSQVYKLELKGLLSGDLNLFKETARFKDNVFRPIVPSSRRSLQYRLHRGSLPTQSSRSGTPMIRRRSGTMEWWSTRAPISRA